jgi:carbon-monoxide dehydrogenase medium subunit
MSASAYRRPTSVEAAIAQLVAHRGEAHVMAGGTALTLLGRQGLIEPALVVDLAAIPGLDDVRAAADGGVTIGAMATLRRVETSPIVRERVPDLAAVIARVATIRIRNQATLGGNLAHADPAQDPPPMLIALDADVEIAGPDGHRREMVESLFLDVFETTLRATEILTAIHVPAVDPSSRIGYEKFLPRTADDYATVAVAARLDVAPDGSVGDARIVLGSVAAVPLRVRAAEDALRGSALAALPVEAAMEAVMTAVDPPDDVRGSADYRREMAGVWTARLLRRLAAEPARAVPA